MCVHSFGGVPPFGQQADSDCTPYRSPPSPGRPKRVFIAHTASARTFAGEKTKWEAADDVCPYTLPLRRLLEPLDCSVHFSPVSSHVLENVVRGQIDPAFAPDGEEGSNLCHLPGLSDAVEAFTPQVRVIVDAHGAALTIIVVTRW